MQHVSYHAGAFIINSITRRRNRCEGPESIFRNSWPLGFFMGGSLRVLFCRLFIPLFSCLRSQGLLRIFEQTVRLENGGRGTHPSGEGRTSRHQLTCNSRGKRELRLCQMGAFHCSEDCRHPFWSPIRAPRFPHFQAIERIKI